MFLPLAYGNVGTTVLDAARGFDGNVVQPRTQTAFSATASYPVLAAARWAAKNQAADRVQTARVAAAETRRQVAVAAAQAYLAVDRCAQRQREITVRNRDTARALEDYARTRLEAGQGSRLNHVRSVQQLASAEALIQLAELVLRQAQEALGVVVFAAGPVDARGEPALPPALPPADDAWLVQRTDVRLFTAELEVAERVASDAWKSWLPTGTASFTPRYVTPAGLFEPSKTWRAFFQLEIPIFDGTLGPQKRARIADRDTARLRLDALAERGALGAAGGAGGGAAQRADRDVDPAGRRERRRGPPHHRDRLPGRRHDQHRGGAGPAGRPQRGDRGGPGRGPAASGPPRPPGGAGTVSLAGRCPRDAAAGALAAVAARSRLRPPRPMPQNAV